MTRPDPKGWCPGAYRPMMSGDGLVVRVRPMLARLTRPQVLGLCAAAHDFGSGLIDLTSRANLQLRGVAQEDHEALLERLHTIGLLPDDPDLEDRRNILIPPTWTEGDDSQRIASELVERLSELPAMPAKIGYAVDAGPAPVMTGNSADFRIERSESGGLILRADGAALGRSVTLEGAVDALIAMAQWFEGTRNPTARRMAAHLQSAALPADWLEMAPAAPAPALHPGTTPQGAVFGAAFGQIEADKLAYLVSRSGAQALRVTPWRLFLLEGADSLDTRDFITAPDDPLLQVDACPGAPLCTASSVDTRGLARQLAARVTGPLHVSGCAKGCARAKPCRTTLVGRNGAFDLVRNGAAWDEPVLTGLDPKTLPQSVTEL